MLSARNICVPIYCRRTPVRARELLRKYLDLRIAFYEESDTGIAAEIGQQTASAQGELWAVVKCRVSNGVGD